MTSLVLSALVLVAAHNASQGESRFDVQGDHVVVDVTLDRADLAVLCSGDAHSDIADADAACVAASLRQSLRLRPDVDAPLCEISDTTSTQNGMQMRLHAVARCQTPVMQLHVDWGLFVGTGFEHSNVATVVTPHGEVRVLLSSRMRKLAVPIVGAAQMAKRVAIGVATGLVLLAVVRWLHRRMDKRRQT